VLIDLRAPHEAVVEEAALREEKRVGDAGQHLGAVGGAHLVRRDGQPAGLDARADDAALDHHGQLWRVSLLCERGGEQGHPDTRKHRRVVAKHA